MSYAMLIISSFGALFLDLFAVMVKMSHRKTVSDGITKDISKQYEKSCI